MARSFVLLDLINTAGCEVRIVALKGLDEPRLGELVAAVSGETAGETSIRRLYSLTGGNPFLALELVRDASGLLSHDVASDAVSELPERVDRTLRRRLAQLPAETHTILKSAAVIGVEFSVILVQQVQDIQGSIIRILEPALTDGLIRSSPERHGFFRFAHSLIRDALYLELTLAARLELHVQIAQMLEKRVDSSPETLFQIAYHYHIAVPHIGAANAVKYALIAAERASKTLAYEVVKHYCAALELIDTKLVGIALQHEGNARIRLMAEVRRRAERVLAQVPAFRIWAPFVMKAALEVEGAENPSKARQELAVLTEEVLQARLGLAHLLNALCPLSSVACALQDVRQTHLIYERLLPYAGLGSVSLATYLGPVNHYLGCLAVGFGNCVAAERHFAAAHAEMKRLRARGWLARSCAEAGALLGPSWQPSIRFD